MNFQVGTARAGFAWEQQRKKLWRDCFHDTPEQTDFFFDACYPFAKCLECRDGDELAGALYLLPAHVNQCPAYYGYAVGTAPAYRGKGVCRMLHQAVFRLCDREECGYYLHPANAPLFAMYAGFGMTLCGSVSEVRKVVPAQFCQPVSITKANENAVGKANTASARLDACLLPYALTAVEKEGGFCVTTSTGHTFAGVKEKDKLLLSFASAEPMPEELYSLGKYFDIKEVCMRLPGADIPFLMGYRINSQSLFADFILD